MKYGPISIQTHGAVVAAHSAINNTFTLRYSVIDFSFAVDSGIVFG